MIIERAENPRGWTTMPNSTIEDGKLTLAARGLLVYLISRPPGWQTDSIRLARSVHAELDGRDGIRTMLSLLEARGYLQRVKRQDSRGRWSTICRVWDTPQNQPLVDRADVLP